MTKRTFTAFDIDGTIWPFDIENMWLKQLVDDGVMHHSVAEKNQKFLRGHSEGTFDEKGYLDFFLNQFYGWHISRLRDFSNKVFEKFSKNSLYEEAISIIRQSKENGEFVFLLTAANNIAAAPFGNRLGVEIVVSTELEFDSQECLTRKIIEPYCYGIGKVKKSLDLCILHNLDLKEGTYFGDSPSDAQMFEQVRRAVVVNPTPELEKRARNNRWEIVRWNI
jgi:HAD superfamily hydrolase (TIGR01490 family)